ncbi:hypothetical protein DOK67_0001077 [Enterococcus sp. DIV0212c]|uniref:helix-turn-helix domain-containing protein n=1 Tax=Enterococcus sp. DIV0212c TaxID=2230867 RepID=UPI001A9BFC2E|nr:helix-turn-helix domain-containing protein [Enterococcus sp. DIV0212c]MBO1354434.1 helix-turn-helix domain-containing protein [Enterococcus sp. DIV0212c]
MKRSDFEPLSYFNDEQRAAAVDIYKIIEPNIIGEVPLPRISNETTIPLRTLQRWKNGYQKYGLSGLIRSPRSDSGSTKVDTTVQSLIENTRFNNRRISITTIHRKVSAQCNQQSLPVPSYKQVYRIVKSMSNSIIELAHHGVKSYSEKYDLIYIREAGKPNEFWQSDHTLLDIEVLMKKCNGDVLGYR